MKNNREFCISFIKNNRHDFRSSLICNSSSCLSSMNDGASSMTSRPLLFLGNAMQSRILSRPANMLTKRSKPKANPAWGGAPYLNAFIKNPNCASALSRVKPSTSNIFSCSWVSWIRILPPPTSMPLHTKS